MATVKQHSEDGRAGAKGILGDVLYANKARAFVFETEWVELVQSIVAGDQRALYCLYDRTHRIVFTLAVRITNNRETAEEVTLDVFHEVWRRAGNYDAANGSVVGWVMNMARSRAIDRVRLEQRKKRINGHPHSLLEATTAADPRETLEDRELGSALRPGLLALTLEERQAIEAAYFSELTHVEVAGRLNEPLGTIKTRIRSGLGKLRKVLSGLRQ
jgi:RNA polymerase sigma-70 factor, ECF subfamily